ncbi:hypothetical protein Tco_0860388 [Tanacetum coccineum]|uniref:Uncharacterized protein n=1 Tax=Tanacetum coccineum TaxID=301880 RepID=A0ABQ5BFD5_9ASTR
MISNVTPLAWRGHLDNQLDVDLLNLHDRCYARQSVVDNVVNRRARELLRVVDQMKGGCDVLKEREKARDKECEELKAKCEAAMADFDNNPCARLQWWILIIILLLMFFTGYQENLTTLESKVAALEVEKGRLEAVEATHRQEVKVIKCGRVGCGHERTPRSGEVIADTSASVEAFLSKKPKSLRRLTLTKTYALAPSTPSQKATPSSTPMSKSVSPPPIV